MELFNLAWTVMARYIGFITLLWLLCKGCFHFPWPNFIWDVYLQRAKMTDFDRFKVMKAKRMVSTVHTHFYSLVDLVNLVMTSYCSIKIFSDSVKPLANVFFFCRGTRSSSMRWRNCRRRRQRSEQFSQNKPLVQLFFGLPLFLL